MIMPPPFNVVVPAYQDIITWCETVKEARGELTYQQKRDFLHVLGIVVVAKRDEEGQVACSMQLELPEIKELFGQSADFEERSSMILSGSARIALGVGCLWLWGC